MFCFFKKYHYIPPCPKCGSKRTGRFIYVSNTININRLIATNLKNGELTKVKVGFGEIIDTNAYCEECGLEWFAKIEELPLNEERIKKECKDRNITNQKYETMKNIKKINREKKKGEKKLKRKQKRKKIKK